LLLAGLNGRKGPIAQFRLERTPDKREVDGSSPSRPTTLCGFEISNLKFEIPGWGCSSAGRAPALHAGGHRFDPVHLHQIEWWIKWTLRV
jgi:hypothetical protein